MIKIGKFIKTRWYLIGLFFVIFFVAFNFQKSKVNSQKDKQLYKVKKETLRETLSLSGEIDADEKATLRFQTSGRLAWVGVKEGDYVKKYQTIASLDQRSLRKTLEKHLRDYMKERWDFEEDKNVTYKDMPLTDTIKRILEKNQFDLDKAVLDVELQNIALEYSTLWTPIEGVVTRIDAPFAGVNITPAQAEFEIVNPKTIYFSATAEQADVVNLKEGLKGKIIFDAFPERT